MKMFQRMLALLLATVMCLGMMTMAVSAAPAKNQMDAGPGYLWWFIDDYRDHIGFWGQKNLKRGWVQKIEFHDSIPADAPRSLDFSMNKDGSVIGWYTPNTLHVAANGKIVLGPNCSGMFAYFSNLEEIKFNGCVDTSEVENMNYMFYGCRKLKALDVSDFDTSSATTMRFMFAYCDLVPELDVSKFNTSKATDLSYMFYHCVNVEKLDVSGFDTSRNMYLNGMFYDCAKVTELDVSKFDTSKVIGMCHTFVGCGAHDTVDVSGFDTSSVVECEGFMEPGRLVNGQPWENLFTK